MKNKILPLLIVLIALASCGTSKKFQASFAEDKPLFAAINALNKKPGNEKARYDLQILYPKSVERHEEAMEVYKNSEDEYKWDKVLNELNALQHIYISLQATPGSFSIIKPKNYLRDIEGAKEEAAEDFYIRAQNRLAESNRAASLQAWQYFKKSVSYVNGYKDADKMIKEAYEKSIVNVGINPIEESNLYSPGSGNWSFTDFRYRPQEYQDALVRDLGGRTANYIPARFYNDRDVRRENIEADWEIGIRWRSVDPGWSAPRQYSRQASRSVENGKDTSGKPVYTTVFATLYITESSYSARGNLEYRITDINNRTEIDNGFVSDEVNWTESTASYSGDSRALSQEDWMLVNNRNRFNQPSRGEVLNSLMRKMYPDLKRRIQRSIEQ